MAFFDSFDRDLDLFVPFSISLLIVIFNVMGVMQRLTLLNIYNRLQINMTIRYNHTFLKTDIDSLLHIVIHKEDMRYV